MNGIQTKRFNHKKLSIILLALFLQFSLLSKAQLNSKMRLTHGWEFVKGDLGSLYEAWRPKKRSRLPQWEKIQLPHCYNAFDAVDPDKPYYQGPAWYRTYLKIDNPYENGRILLHFEGAGQKTNVYVYMQKVAQHVGGYDEFTVDITEAVLEFISDKEKLALFDGKIPIAIRSDNSRDVQMIPSDLSDFNLYGGLYRYVNLVYVPDVSLERVHINHQLDLNANRADVQVNSRLYNPEYFIGEIKVTVDIFSPDKQIIETYSESINAWQGGEEIFSFQIKKPELWSPDAPNLYTCKVSIETDKGRHTVNEMFGIRHFEFIKNGPFKLNGERLLLRGTHRHEDHAGTAAAMTESMIIKEMQMMKDMGVNFIRLGHYQQSRIVLNQCDNLGILVWEEIPWCRGGLGNEKYKAQARRMLTNMIDQHRNHPSVIIWGLGNENDWPGDFQEFDKQAIREFMKELHLLAHALDNTRKTAIRRCNFCKDIVNVYSPSIWAGWYRGKYTEYKEVSRREMQTVDHYLHVEWGASNHARRHSEAPDIGLDKIATKGAADERDGDFLLTGGDPRVSKDGDWSETYACNLIDWHLKEQETMPWLTGTAYWPFKDFSTPLRPGNPVPYVNQKGVVERDFTKKEGYYVFQSYWTEKPMIHIYGHTWETRWGKEGEQKMVKVYSNCSEAELFLNGKSLGKKTRNSQNFPAAGLRWIVTFKPGKNQLEAIAKKGKVTVNDTLTVNYQTKKWNKPQKLHLEKKSEQNNTVIVCAKALDEKNIPCLDATDFVVFDITGDGQLIDNKGTSTGARKVQLYNGRAIIGIKLNHGESIVSVKSNGMKTAFLRLEKK